MSPLGAGVIGLGVGAQHAQAYATHPGCELVAVCDLDERKLDEVRGRFPGVHVTTDAAELIRSPHVNVISIASYDDCHYEQAKAAIEAGKHAFVEKPLCLRREEAETLRRLLAVHPEVVLSSNLLLRTSPRFVQLKRLIDEGRFGDLFYVEGDYDYGRLHKITHGWRGDLPYYSVMLGGGVHVVDLLLWLTGDRVVDVFAAGNKIASRGSKFRFNDLVVATLRFEGGLLGKVTANFGCVMPHFHGLTVFGTEGTFVNGLEHATLFTASGQERLDAAYPGVGKGDLVHSFIDAVLGQGAPVVTAAEVFATMDVCLAIEEAVRTESRVPVSRPG